MPIIAVANPKGGSGKTTVATSLARGLEAAGDRVLLVDADPQGSARDWQAADDDNPTPVVGMDTAGSLRGLADVASAYDWAVIDVGGRFERIMAEAVRAADLVLIPVQPSPYDIWALGDLIEVIRSRQTITDGQPIAGAVINRAIHGTRLGSEITDALAELELEHLDARIHQRQVFARSANDGLTPLDAEPSGAAAQEIKAMVDEIRGLFTHLSKGVNE